VLSCRAVRFLSSCLACVACGCGLTLDLAPEDRGDAGLVDAGAFDASPKNDAHRPDAPTTDVVVVVDASPPPDDARVCSATELCNGADDDCDTAIDEGFDLATDPAHCGSCGHECSSDHGTPSCDRGDCRIACDPGWGDCDLDASSGCETDLTSVDDCGACGVVCGSTAPVCRMEDSDTAHSCSEECGDLAVCDGTCVDLEVDTRHCGSCGNDCSPAHGVGSCMGSTCHVDYCRAGWSDCDGDPTNGCETDVTTTDDCGDCGSSCGFLADCMAGRCVDVACGSGSSWSCSTMSSTCTATCGGAGVTCDSTGACTCLPSGVTCSGRFGTGGCDSCEAALRSGCCRP